MSNNNCTTNHAIMFFFILTILLVGNHDSLFSSSSKTIKSTSTDSPCSRTSAASITTIPTQIPNFVFSSFLSGVLITLLWMKRFRPSPPSPSPPVDQQPSPASSSGISASLLKSLPIFVYCAENRPKLGKNGGECVICLTDFINDQTLRWLPDCDQLFHRGCIDTWLESHKTCPCCRAKLERVHGEIP